MRNERMNSTDRRTAMLLLVSTLGLVAFLSPITGCMEMTPTEASHKPVENLTYVATNAGFGQVALRAKTAVLVDFYADWCPPCKQLAPVLDRLAPGYKGKVAFVKVNVDKLPGLAQEYRIEGIPTLLILKNGREVKRMVGSLPERRLRAELDAAGG